MRHAGLPPYRENQVVLEFSLTSGKIMEISKGLLIIGKNREFFWTEPKKITIILSQSIQSAQDSDIPENPGIVLGFFVSQEKPGNIMRFFHQDLSVF